MASDKNTAIIVVAGIAVVGILAYVAYKALRPLGEAAKSAASVLSGPLAVGNAVTAAFNASQKDLVGGYDWLAARLGMMSQWTAGANAPGSEADVMARQKAAGDATAATWTPADITRLHSYIVDENANLPAHISRAQQGFYGGL